VGEEGDYRLRKGGEGESEAQPSSHHPKSSSRAGREKGERGRTGPHLLPFPWSMTNTEKVGDFRERKKKEGTASLALHGKEGRETNFFPSSAILPRREGRLPAGGEGSTVNPCHPHPSRRRGKEGREKERAKKRLSLNPFYFFK